MGPTSCNFLGAHREVSQWATPRRACWLDGNVIEQLKKRNTLLKTARMSNSVLDWANYRAARNKAVSLLTSAKSRFFTTTLEKERNNPKVIWKTIKPLIGDNKYKCCTRNNGQTSNNTVEMAQTFNSYFSTIADRLRTLSLNQFPEHWKTARITPIFKNGDQTEMTNYHPKFPCCPYYPRLLKDMLIMRFIVSYAKMSRSIPGNLAFE